MRTALFVYQSTSVNISTNENDLELCGMNTDPMSLQYGDNAQMIAPGIYKIVSSLGVHISGDDSAFEVVTTNNKENDPKPPPPPPPSRAVAVFAPVDIEALQAFLALPDAKDVVNP
jgi:hypothetical protein